MIFTDSPEINPNLRLDDLPGTFSDAVGASAVSALYSSPVWQLKRTWDDKFNAGGAMLDYETARTKSKSAGVDVQIDPKGMTEGALDMLIERKRFQARTQDAIARGPQGFAAGSAYFLTGLGAAMLDPINLASAFIPVARGLGMAKDVARAGMLGEVGAAATATGRAAARIRVGAVEGAVGQAILEPLTAFRASQEQEDYGITDTLLNVGFGAALGAAAHAGLGALGDRAVAAARGRKAEALIGKAKDIQENPVNYDIPTVFRADSAAARLRAADLETNSAVFRSEVAAAADGRKMDNGVLVAPTADRATSATQEIFYHGTNNKFDTFDPTMGSTPGSWFTKDKAAAEQFGEVGAFTVDVKNPATMADLAAARQEVAKTGLDPMADTQAFNKAVIQNLEAKGFDGVRDSNFRGAGGEGAGVVAAFRPEQIKRVSETTSPAAVDPIKVQQAAAASHLPENDVHFDAQAKAEVDATVASRAAEVDPVEAVLRATQEAQAELATLSQQLGLDPEKNAVMRSADDMAATASRYSKAIEAYASCQVRS